MKYKDYLKTEHWKLLKKDVLSRRTMCQNCTSKKRLLIHHKNYRCLFNETDNDIIVMCFDCHHAKHKKKKFKIKGVNLNFTRAKNTDKNFYKISENSPLKIICPRCAEKHGAVYKKFKSGEMHLAIICPNSKPRTQYIPFITGLSIPQINGKFEDQSNPFQYPY